jgi:putative flippase GtrA
MAMFFIVNFVGIAIRVPILKFVEPPVFKLLQGIGVYFSNSNFIAKNITLAIAMAVVMLWNFFVNRYWTYNDVDKVDE